MPNLTAETKPTYMEGVGGEGGGGRGKGGDMQCNATLKKEKGRKVFIHLKNESRNAPFATHFPKENLTYSVSISAPYDLWQRFKLLQGNFYLTYVVCM